MNSHHVIIHSHDILEPSRVKPATETIAALKLIKKAIEKHNSKAINKKKPLELIEQIISLTKKYPSLEPARQLIKTLSDHLKESDRLLSPEFIIARDKYNDFCRSASRESLIYTSKEQYTADEQGTIKSGCHEEYIALARQLIQSLEKVETMAKMIEHIKTSLSKLNLPKNDVQSVLQDYANLHNAYPGLLHHSPLDLKRLVKYLPRIAYFDPTNLGGPEMASFAYEIVSIYFAELEFSRQVYDGLRTWLDPYISIETELTRLQIEAKAGIEADLAAILVLRSQALNVLQAKEGGTTKQQQTAIALKPKTEAPPSHIPDCMTVDFPADKLKHGKEIISELKDLEKKVRKTKDKTQSKKDTLIMIHRLIERIEKNTFSDPAKEIIKSALNLMKEIDMFCTSVNWEGNISDLDSFLSRNKSEPHIRIYAEDELFKGQDGIMKNGKHHEFMDLTLKILRTNNEFTAFALRIKHARSRMTAVDFKSHAQAIRLAIAEYEEILYGKYQLNSYLPGFTHNDQSNMTQFNIILRNYYVTEYAVCKAVKLGLAQSMDLHMATRAEKISEIINFIGEVNDCFGNTLDARGSVLKAMKQHAIKEMLGEPLTPQSNPAAFFPPPPRANTNTPASITPPPVVTKPKVAPQKYLPVPAVPPKAVVQTYISVPAKLQDVKSAVPATAAPQAVATPPVKTSTLETLFYAHKKVAPAKAPIPPPRPPVKK
jgi:hypothetical protein